ncbi:uncharacterized protein LOC115633940 [Scaptodrosophila lebanonensis]|uniref:Uncharacterized protein LOC115633940 n=1 Tax=Drosophila lebanonensis TaxID=7225 RepID=A0A6J2UIJ2_DROLE|nr:uncharacterized protein LOC115633940 [Scaptodrosophila lebanonensis]
MTLSVMHLSPAHLRIVVILSLLQQLTLKRQSHIFQEHLESDLRDCRECFAAQIENCLGLYESLAEPEDLNKLLKDITLRLDYRHNYWLRLKSNNATLLAKRSTVEIRRAKGTKETSIELLRAQFLSSVQRPGQFQLCSGQNTTKNESHRFVEYFRNRGHLELTIWYYMTHYITPLLMQELWALQWPVPRIYAACGLTYFQAYAGRTLSEFGQEAPALRYRLAQQLLELALKMTFGFDNFRIYITDFTTDNFAYDETRQELTVIDLDTIVVVDAATPLREAEKYAPMPGSDDVFTYDVVAFCAGQLTDANVYQACRLLSDFLLHDADEDLHMILLNCVLCADELCDLRFQYAYDLIKIFKQGLE